MTNELDTYVPPPAPVQETKRIIADAIKRQATQTVFSNADGKKISYKDQLAVMLWDLVTFGSAQYVTGESLVLEDYDDWLSTVKYLSSHLDGGVDRGEGGGVNVYKVYVGIDNSRV